MSSCFSTAPRPAKGSASTQYQCIICDEFLSSKGVCKRHLEDQHVSPKQYKCEKCALVFSVKAKCKEHIKDCGKGVFLYVVCKPEEKKAYGCEFTGDVFSSMARYVEHLLNLSERIQDRPAGDLHRKLYALLDRQHLEPHVAEISSRVYGSSSAWRNLYWDVMQLDRSIEVLEHAIVYEDGTLEIAKHVANGDRIQLTETFVYGLLCEGKIRPNSRHTIRPGSGKAMSRSSSTSFGSTKTITPKGSLNPISAPMPAAPMTMPEATSVPAMPPIPSSMAMSIAAHATVAQVATMDVKGKRHLSDHSRNFVPNRLPPGPPLPSDLSHLYQLHAQTSGHATPPNVPTTSLPFPPNVSTTSLPFRPPDVQLVDQTSLPMDYQPRTVYTPSIETQPRQVYTPSIGDQSRHVYTPSIGDQSRQVYTPSSIETTGSSDNASVSTIMSNYQEPELVTPMFDYNMWPGQPHTIAFPIPPTHNTVYNMPQNPEYYYHHPSVTSTRTPSVATDQTYVVDYSNADRKSINFDSGSMHAVPQSGTFLWDDEEGNEVNGMN